MCRPPNRFVFPLQCVYSTCSLSMFFPPFGTFVSLAADSPLPTSYKAVQLLLLLLVVVVVVVVMVVVVVLLLFFFWL